MTKDKQAQAAASELQNRRKIVKGLVGLPAVLTLSNGAQGATASALECLNPDIKLQPVITPNTPDASGTRNCEITATPYSPTFPDLFYTSDGAARFENNLGGPGDGQYCVAYFNPATGEFVSFDNTDGTPAYASCYASIVTSGL